MSLGTSYCPCKMCYRDKDWAKVYEKWGKSPLKLKWKQNSVEESFCKNSKVPKILQTVIGVRSLTKFKEWSMCGCAQATDRGYFKLFHCTKNEVFH